MSNAASTEEKQTYRSVTRKLTSTGNGVAALLSSLVNTLLAYPLDVVKTRFQGRYLFQLCTHAPNSTRSNTKQAIKIHYHLQHHEKDHRARRPKVRLLLSRVTLFRGLYTGVGLGMFGAALAWSAYMKIYAQIKDHYESQGVQLKTRHIAVASMTGSKSSSYPSL